MLREARLLVESSQRAILNCDDHALRATFWTLAAATYHRLNERAKMYAAFSAARGYAFCVGDRDVAGELAYYEASVAWSEGEIEEAERLCEPALESESGGIRAHAHLLMGLVASARRQPEVQLQRLEAAWEAIAARTDREQYLAAHVIYSAVALAVELGRHEAAQSTFERMRAVEWTADLAYHRFQILRCLAWDAALSGDHLTAFRLWRESATYAPAPAWKLAALVERTFLAAEMGQPTFAREELSSAVSIAETIDWEASQGDERLELLALAEVASAIDPAEGARFLAAYRGLGTAFPPYSLYQDENPEREAIESYHAGVIALRLGETAEAGALLVRAFDIFVDYGFVRRAMQCAIHLAPLQLEPRYGVYAIANAGRFPNSWLARAVAELPSSAAKRP
jgi:tetratricopeptide (TPR) repeat protein